MDTTDVTERVTELVEPLLAGHGDAELYDVVYSGSTLQVLVSGGLDLDELAEVTRLLSAELDAADPVPGHYTLEVSSPGLERTLRTRRHFTGAVGERVKVKVAADADGERRVEGVLAAADDEGFTVDTQAGPRRLSYDEVVRARTVFEWGTAAKPVSPSKKGRGSR